MMPFCFLLNNENDIRACSEQTVTHTALIVAYSLKNQCSVWNIILYVSNPYDAGILKLWPLLYRHPKVHKNAVNAMVTCS